MFKQKDDDFSVDEFDDLIDEMSMNDLMSSCYTNMPSCSGTSSNMTNYSSKSSNVPSGSSTTSDIPSCSSSNSSSNNLSCADTKQVAKASVKYFPKGSSCKKIRTKDLRT